MNEQVIIRQTAGTRGTAGRWSIEVLDRRLVGRPAEFRLVAHAQVKDSRPVNATRELFNRKIEALGERLELDVPDTSPLCYSYNGAMLDIRVEAELRVDDGLIFDTKIRTPHNVSIGTKPVPHGDAKNIVEPRDAFNFFKNVRAIPAENRIITYALAIAGALLISLNTLVGVHDQLVPEPRTYFFSHRDSDGDAQSPLFNSLAASGVLGAAIWAAMRRQLRKYMSFEFGKLPSRIRPGDNLRVSDLIHGRPRVPLHNATVRLVACNMEKGQYKRGSGTKQRTVSFSHPVRGVILFEKGLKHVPAGARLESFLQDTVCFDPMFHGLYPPQPISSTHGLAVYWEAQLIHEDFIDQELVGSTDCFDHADFLTHESPGAPNV